MKISKSSRFNPEINKVGGCIVLIVISALLLWGVMTASPADNIDRNVIGKHAYNKTNGVYIGVIITTKECRLVFDKECYLINQGEGYSRHIEFPTSMVNVKNLAPTRK